MAETEKPSRADEILDEIDAGRWTPASVRMSMVGVADGRLEQIANDESRRLVERDVPRQILQERADERELERQAKERADLERAEFDRREREKRDTAAREAAAARVEAREAARQPDPVPPAQDAQKGKLRHPRLAGHDNNGPNATAARSFAASLTAAGLDCEARPTLSLSNRGPVKDGWTVNVRDDALELGFVASWYGRGHFQCYAEIAGHIERTDEAAALCLAMWREGQAIEDGEGG
jgi:hypothetical protein